MNKNGGSVGSPAGVAMTTSSAATRANGWRGWLSPRRTAIDGTQDADSLLSRPGGTPLRKDPSELVLTDGAAVPIEEAAGGLHGDTGRPRTMGAFAVAIVSFAAVAGGPYGIEAAIGAAGPLPVLIGSIVLAVAWSMTQSLVAAELATAFPSNGGYITWVTKGMGPVLGFVNALNCISSAFLNLPLYPVLFASYVQQLFPDISSGGLWAVKLCGLVLTVVLNALGIEAVEWGATIMTLVVQTPFIVIPIAAAAYGQPFDWSALGTSVPGWGKQLSLFVSTLCWNAQGWVNVGNIASEVKNPRKSFPIGAGVGVVMVLLNYVYPITFCFPLQPDASKWVTGYFATVGTKVAPWVGYWATVAAAFSCMNNAQPQMASTARALRFAALYRMIPIPWLRHNWHRFNTPLPAILMQAVVVAVLMSLNFAQLVTLNVLFYNVGLLLQFMAFLRLRYSQPHLARPYEVPGGKIGAWAVVLLFYFVLFLGFVSAIEDSPKAMILLVAANVVFVIGGFAWARWGYSARACDIIDEAEARGVDASSGTTAAVVAVQLKASRENEQVDVSLTVMPRGSGSAVTRAGSDAAESTVSLLSLMDSDVGGTPKIMAAAALSPQLPALNGGPFVEPQPKSIGVGAASSSALPSEALHEPPPHVQTGRSTRTKTTSSARLVLNGVAASPIGQAATAQPDRPTPLSGAVERDTAPLLGGSEESRSGEEETVAPNRPASPGSARRKGAKR